MRGTPEAPRAPISHTQFESQQRNWHVEGFRDGWRSGWTEGYRAALQAVTTVQQELPVDEIFGCSENPCRWHGSH